jgi:hypothetical protein
VAPSECRACKHVTAELEAESAQLHGAAHGLQQCTVARLRAVVVTVRARPTWLQGLSCGMISRSSRCGVMSRALAWCIRLDATFCYILRDVCSLVSPLAAVGHRHGGAHPVSWLQRQAQLQVLGTSTPRRLLSLYHTSRKGATIVNSHRMQQPLGSWELGCVQVPFQTR